MLLFTLTYMIFLDSELIGGTISVKRKPKVLVIGAGVIGSFLIHKLCAAGNNVTVLARGKTLEKLCREGLITEDYFTRRVYRDRPRITDRITDEYYDIVFAVMQYTQMPDVLNSLAAVNAPAVVLVGNNLSAHDMKRQITERAAIEGSRCKHVLFGFQPTAGRRTKDLTVTVAFGKGSMVFGGLGEKIPAKLTRFMFFLFRGTGYTLTQVGDMDAFLKHHMDIILPVTYLCYRYDCDLRKVSAQDISDCLDAAAELYDTFEKMGIYSPDDDGSFYRRSRKRELMAKPVFMAIAKTKLGELVASEHCRNASAEMSALNSAVFRIIPEDADIPHLKNLRASCRIPR